MLGLSDIDGVPRGKFVGLAKLDSLLTKGGERTACRRNRVSRRRYAIRRSVSPARGLFGHLFVDHYATTRLWESREYERHMNDWQLRRYSEII